MTVEGVRLTERGENLLLIAIGAVKVTAAMTGLLLLIGVAGWIEGI